MSEEKVTRHQALKWCQNCLRGAWSKIDAEQMRLDQVLGGLSNHLYCCSLPDHVEVQNNEPRKILLRIYGEAHRKHRETLLIDSVVSTLLSERKLGPYVYGIFPDGRLEEFIEAESLHVSEIRDTEISQKLARILAQLHQINMPLVKEPIWLFHTIEQYLIEIPSDLNNYSNDNNRQIFEELRSVCNFNEEFQNLKNILATVDSPVCFSHNDFQPGNILRLKSEPNNFTAIDFEYCSYNYRGFDFGNHFCEFMFDYKSATEWPFFHVDFTLYPNENQQMNFLRSYVGTIVSNKEVSNTSADVQPINQDVLARHMMKEANYFALASHFLWTLWGIAMATSTTIQFGYMEYARTRLTAYYLIRDMITASDAYLPPRMTENILRSSQNPFYQSYIKTKKN